ncbi:alkaline phosphatase family protein [Anatilimnocola floriformis]|uniref:alkaline phosphatase family protein n=1 Tax=Anatilimnocola floriformis TaxID=2948575 RepID=UPI0020C44925|nr:alkaline phosphatase family protein [Anatilimnocola floriformis]
MPVRLLSIGSFFSLLALVLFGSAQAQEKTGPRLMVVVSVDQFCQDYLIRFQDNFPEDTKQSFFRNVLQNGAFYANCHHAHAITITAPGHSVQLTGAYPGTTGVIENDWFDRATGKIRYCVSDPLVEIIGITGGKPMSPRVLLVDTVGDRLKLANSQSKVFGVAIKDRASILMSGHRADCAFWMEKNQWVTSTYYRSDLPGYFRNMNDAKAVEQFRGQTWELLLPKEKYHNQQFADDNVHENPPSGWTAAFPHAMAKAGEMTADKYGDHVLFSPFGNDYTLLAARTVIENEKLGADDAPDLLTINFSSNDYVGHAFGPLSLEVEDITYRTDRQLAGFVKYLDEQVGAGKWTLALTADHGVAPIPELVAERPQVGERTLPAKRNPIGDSKVIKETLEKLLRQEIKVKELQDPKTKNVILDLDSNQVYLNYDHPNLKANHLVQARELIRDWLLRQNYVAAAYTREELLAGGDARLLAKMRLSFNPQRSGDVQYCYTPYSIPGVSGAKPRGTTHGSPWHYDTHVPMLLIGNSIVTGKYERRISPAFLAPTASRLLGVDSPGGCQEDPLLEALTPKAKF